MAWGEVLTSLPRKRFESNLICKKDALDYVIVFHSMSYTTSDWKMDDEIICKELGMAEFNVISQLLAGRDDKNQKHLLRQCMVSWPISET